MISTCDNRHCQYDDVAGYHGVDGQADFMEWDNNYNGNSPVTT